MFFLICLEELHSLEAPASFFFQLQLKGGSNPNIFMLQPKGGYNFPILWIQQEGGFNPLCSLATTGRWLQPPILAMSNRLEI
jgi:hypothetical protein